MAAPSSASTVIKQAHDGGSVVLTDGTGTPLTITLKFDNADFKLDGVSKDLREVVTYTGRGKTRGVRYGAPKYPTWSCSVQVADLSESSAGTVLDWINKIAPFTARVSTMSIGEVDAMTVTFNQEGTSYGDSIDQAIKVEQATVDAWSFSEGAPNTISLSGTVYGDVTIDGVKHATAPR